MGNTYCGNCECNLTGEKQNEFDDRKEQPIPDTSAYYPQKSSNRNSQKYSYNCSNIKGRKKCTDKEILTANLNYSKSNFQLKL